MLKTPETSHDRLVDLPYDIVTEILTRLPVKSLLRFKCACRPWLTMIQSREFIQKHMRFNKRDFMYNQADDIEFKPAVYGSTLLLEKSMEIDENNKYNYRLSNPSTRQVLILPEVNVDEKYVHMGFLYLPSIGKYKLVYTFRIKGTRNLGCKVLTLGVDHTWTTVDIPSLNNFKTNNERRILRNLVGGVYYFAGVFVTLGFGGSHELVYFEIESENYGTINVPHNSFKCWKSVGLLTWGSKLSLWRRVGTKLYVLVLEDYKKQKWADKKIVISLKFLEKYETDQEKFVPKILKNGRLWFCPYDKYRLSYNIKSRKHSCVITPSGKKFSYCVYPNLRTF